MIFNEFLYFGTRFLWDTLCIYIYIYIYEVNQSTTKHEYHILLGTSFNIYIHIYIYIYIAKEMGSDLLHFSSEGSPQKECSFWAKMTKCQNLFSTRALKS